MVRSQIAAIALEALTCKTSSSWKFGPQSFENNLRMYELRSVHSCESFARDERNREGEPLWQSWVLPEEEGIKHIKAACVV
jgi:hypothetical protein